MTTTENDRPTITEKGEFSVVLEGAARPSDHERNPYGTALTLVPPNSAHKTISLPTGSVAADDIEGAFAPNTWRTYRSSWKTFMAWCGVNGRNALPATPEDIADYVKERAVARSMVTIQKDLAAIKAVHRVANIALDMDAPVLHFALRRLAREYGLRSEGKAELMTADIEAMIATRGTSLAGQRDRAILLLGFASGLRRSELAALDVTDIEWRRDGIHLHINRSKTDQEGRGQIVGVLYGQKNGTCPIRALKRRLDLAGLTEGPLFRPIYRKRVGDHRLQDRSIYELVKASASAAGLDADRYGAHSLRIGHVTQALENGADITKAKEQLRHTRIETTEGYNRRRTILGKHNSSGKLGL